MVGRRPGLRCASFPPHPPPIDTGYTNTHPQQNCFSSFWDSATAWPAPTSYCTASQGASVSSCLQAACSATPTAAASYSSLSSSLCSRWSQCSSAGSTGVYTVSAPGVYFSLPFLPPSYRIVSEKQMC
jgi:hypothetical protein